MTRYAAMFDRLAERGEGAFIPFTVLGDPDRDRTRVVLDALLEGGADALELGIPFSDPVADGPAIQAAAVRALAAGVRLADCWTLVAAVRSARPALPIGLLVYANLVEHRGAGRFYEAAARAGVDSVLVADLPLAEAEPYERQALAAGLAPVFIAPPNATEARLEAMARRGRGYTYVVTRSGVTGVDPALARDSTALIARLRALDAPPPVLGFGIARPAQVQAGLAMGAAGVIAGSAVAERIASHAADPAALHRALATFVRDMKAATRRATTPPAG